MGSDDRMVLEPWDPVQAIGTAEAAELAGVDETTMRIWCPQYGIGRKISGRWRVGIIPLDMLLAGDREALAAYHAGDLHSEKVRTYFALRHLPVPMKATAAARILAQRPAAH